MQLYLVRHAQSQNNALPENQRVEDPGITPLGVLQAESVARRLAQLPFSHLLTSAFRRALETTRPVAQQTGLRPVIWTELHEEGGCYRGYEPGPLEGCPGMTRSHLEQEFADFDLPPDIDHRGWWKSMPFETPDAAQRRADRQMQRLLDTFHTLRNPNVPPNLHICCVIHADIKDRMLRSVLGSNRTHLAEGPLCNTGVTHLNFADSTTEPTVEVFNCGLHLHSAELWTS